MARQKVTLQAGFGRGTFYWVTEVDAESEDEAVMAAENLFMAELEKGHEWEFEDFVVEPA
ncbi:hypothetical protein [Yunchengibacter salinarum]|uniref:hypothetical protein n=1 Tax=Yunchengibacter salinarum TaxID=3133399 RepID=UPI0035B5F5A1